MYWYRQRHGENMRPIVFTTPNTDADFETGFKDERFRTTKPNAESGTLSVEQLRSEDGGVYFCAVSESTVRPTPVKHEQKLQRKRKSGGHLLHLARTQNVTAEWVEKKWHPHVTHLMKKRFSRACFALVLYSC